ncbi:MAG TPA: Arc family DNA-binding protein [Arachnia sp.]|mgnify:CR=1 FL=1|nr:Arc family DNA-binding protein [Arachnia sp.]HMT87553.1 Arc family DNA-binding protein [Arachnia sp.]
MATITVRGLDDDIKDALARRARRHGRSMEAEARQILADVVAADLVYPNALIKMHIELRDEDIELDIPERTYDEPRVTF